MKTIKILEWKHAQELGDSLTLWGFRGQGDANWELETTLHRLRKENNKDFKYLWHREYWMLRQFQRRAHHYCNMLPDYNHKIDWLALMQHYGAPTRLLDFSHSFYVAAFFALENAVDDSAIWAINLDSLRDKSAAYCNVNTNDENIDGLNQRHINFVNEHISLSGEQEKQSNLVVHVEPDRLHERLLTQQGFFLFPCNISESFSNVLTSTLDLPLDELDTQKEEYWDGKNLNGLNIYDHSILKIVLSKTLKYNALTSLRKMNLTAATLFPGLDGFARSMKYHVISGF